MIETGLNKILNEFTNCKKEKDNFIKVEYELSEKFKDFSKSFDKLYKEFSDYIIYIKNSKKINDYIIKNIRKYQTNIINQIEDFKSFKNTKIFELSNLFNEKINIDKFNELIDDILEVNIHINENESLNFDKANSQNYSNFYGSFNNNNSNSLLNHSENNQNNNIIKEVLKCYGCNSEATSQCNNKECYNFLLCKNCIDILSANNEKINHKIIKIEREEYKDKERKKEKYLDLLSEIYKTLFIKAIFYFPKKYTLLFRKRKILIGKKNIWMKLNYYLKSKILLIITK